MGLLLLMLLFFVFCIGQLLQDNGLGVFRDVSFWLIVVAFAAMVTLACGGVQL